MRVLHTITTLNLFYNHNTKPVLQTQTHRNVHTTHLPLNTAMRLPVMMVSCARACALLKLRRSAKEASMQLPQANGIRTKNELQNTHD